MFPSLGYFHATICPDEACTRIFCHFNHSQRHRINSQSSNINKKTCLQKKTSTYNDEALSHDVRSDVSDSIEPTGNRDLQQNENDLEQVGNTEEREISQDTETNEKADKAESSAALANPLDQASLLKQIVSDAVKKALTENPILSSSLDATALVKQLNAEVLVSKAIQQVAGNNNFPQRQKRERKKLYLPPPGTPSYNPTPISKLKSQEYLPTKVVSENEDEYVPTPIATLQENDEESTDFSSIEDEETNKMVADFDLLEEVIAEHSSDPDRTKAIRKRKKAYAKINPKFKHSDKSTLNELCPKNDMHPPNDPTASDLKSTPSSSSLQSIESKKSESLQRELSNSQSDKNEVQETSDNGQKKDEKHSVKETKTTHSLLPKISHLTRPNTKEWVPVAKPPPSNNSVSLNVEDMLQKLHEGISDDAEVSRSFDDAKVSKDKDIPINQEIDEKETPKKDEKSSVSSHDNEASSEENNSSSPCTNQSEENINNIDNSQSSKHKKRQKHEYNSNSSHKKSRKKVGKKEKRRLAKKYKKKRYHSDSSEEESDDESLSDEDGKRKSKVRKKYKRHRSSSHSHRKKSKRRHRKKSRSYHSSSYSSSDNDEKRLKKGDKHSKRRKYEHDTEMPIAPEDIKQERIEIDLTIIKDEEEELRIKKEKKECETPVPNSGNQAQDVANDIKCGEKTREVAATTTPKLSETKHKESMHKKPELLNKEVVTKTEQPESSRGIKISQKEIPSPPSSESVTNAAVDPSKPISDAANKNESTKVPTDKLKSKDSNSNSVSKARLLKEISLFGDPNDFKLKRRKSSDKPSLQKEDRQEAKNKSEAGDRTALRKRSSSSSSSSSKRSKRSEGSLDEPTAEKPTKSSQFLDDPSLAKGKEGGVEVSSKKRDTEAENSRSRSKKETKSSNHKTRDKDSKSSNSQECTKNKLHHSSRHHSDGSSHSSKKHHSRSSSRSHHKSKNDTKEKSSVKEASNTADAPKSAKLDSCHKTISSDNKKEEVALNASLIPDLSALNDISNEDWDELICHSVSNDDLPITTEDTDEGIDPDPISASDLDSMMEQEFGSDNDEPNNPEVMEECLKMFTEFQPTKSEPSLSMRKSGPKREVEAEEEPFIQKQRRVAHNTASGNLITKPKVADFPRKKTPSEMMIERYQKLKEEETALQKKLEQQRKEWEKYMKDIPATSPCISSSSVSSTSGHDDSVAQSPASSSTNITVGKKRIARIPSKEPSGILSKNKMKFFRVPPSRQATSNQSTPSMTKPKGAKRLAHNPNIETLARPIIPVDGKSKVPQNIRQRYLNNFVDEALKFCDGSEHSFKVALAEEKACHNRASSRMVYLNLAVNTLKRLRSKTVSEAAQEILAAESKEESSEEPSSSQCSLNSPSKFKAHPLNPNHKVTSHFSVLSSGGQKGSWSIQKSKRTLPANIEEILSGASYYKLLRKYILSENELEENGFPISDPSEKGKAILKKPNSKKKVSPSETQRYCDRCHVLYSVDELGVPLVLCPCVYHWGRPYKMRGYGSLETKYSCCQMDSTSDGCCQGSTHVSQNFNPDSLRGYVKTIPKSVASDCDSGVFALDCEMCYTTCGNELTRITVIGTDNQTVYETLVRPDNPIIDYNTRFSGITAEDMEGVSVTIRDVQAALLTRFSDKTILMGHSLESDFAALKLIHSTVVDTSIVFPHRLGPPFKRALRNLASEFLKKIIQNDVSGHDSAEDAITCMDLMKWKIKEDLKMLKIS